MSTLIVIDHSKVIRRCVHCHHLFQLSSDDDYNTQLPCPGCGCSAYKHRKRPPSATGWNKLHPGCSLQGSSKLLHGREFQRLIKL